MIIPDVNVLVHAHDVGSPLHAGAKRWWETVLRTEQIWLPWLVIWGFVRVTSGSDSMVRRLESDQAIAFARYWLNRPNVAIVEPGLRHFDIARALAEAIGASGRAMTDVFIAALAVEHNAPIYTLDRDFKAFPGLVVVNPLQP